MASLGADLVQLAGGDTNAHWARQFSSPAPSAAQVRWRRWGLWTMLSGIAFLAMSFVV